VHRGFSKNTEQKKSAPAPPDQAGGSPAAMRALDRVPILSSGVMLPERFMFAADAWTRGEAAILERSDVK
jgi:hypothetical protein